MQSFFGKVGSSVKSGTSKVVAAVKPKKQPVETPVEKWPLDTNAEGLAEKTIQGVQPGQYRLSYKVKDSAGRPGVRCEGNVIGALV